MDLLTSLLPSTAPRPGLKPLPGTVPLTFEAALCPPLIYYIALLFLPPIPPDSDGKPPPKLIPVIRNSLAILAAALFFRLPLAYHVPFSVGLTYQLALVGLYGGCRVVDAFFISRYLFGHVPRRVTFRHEPRAGTPMPIDGGVGAALDVAGAVVGSSSETEEDETPNNKTGKKIDKAKLRRGSVHTTGAESYFDDLVDTATLRPRSFPVLEYASTEHGWPTSWADRASYALELETSMRGVGFTWTTADVRHTRRTWLPSVSSRIHSIVMHCGPVIMTSLIWLRYVYTTFLHRKGRPDTAEDFDELPLSLQLTTTAALGAFLMAAFSVAHSAAAIAAHPLYPHPMAYFPPLYTTRVWNLTSVRGFWSYGWHRLFARLFLVYGVWPGEWLERKLTGKRNDQPADLGKVLGGFFSSAFVHAFAVRTVVGGGWSWEHASGEAVFFAENGVAVVVEELVIRMVMSRRRKAAAAAAARAQNGKASRSSKVDDGQGDQQRSKNKDGELSRWYDSVVGRVWWVAVLLLSGRNFARGWVRAGLVREMSGL